MSSSQINCCRLRSRLCHSSCESSLARLEARPTGAATTARFSELTGVFCENGIPGGKVVMLIPAQLRSWQLQSFRVRASNRLGRSGIASCLRLSRATSSALDPVEVTMKEGSEDCIPRRKGFSTPVTGVHRIPLFRQHLMPKHVHNYCVQSR